MQKLDIRGYKNHLRDRYKQQRRELDVQTKEEWDRSICQRVLGLRAYREASVVLTYVSLPGEIDTHGIILAALRDGKRVAVPYCIENSRRMYFYFIHSMDDLVARTFGVLEPVAERCERVEMPADEKSICIVPGLSFDAAGFRLGYGKGYYDRFLCSYQGLKIGLCYQYAVRAMLPHSRYDVAVDLLITERKVKRVDV